MSRTILTYKSRTLEKEENLLQQRCMDLQPKYKEESIVDCPDCFDAMMKVYDSDKTRYQYENCDLSVGKVGEVQAFDD